MPSELFADGSTLKHFAIVTNREGDGLALIRWHRERAWTVEHVHQVLKNELAAAALSSWKFGADAAWFRLNVLTDNLLSALKRLVLPGDLSEARQKRLRFLVFNTVGKVLHPARRTLVRITSSVQRELLDLVRSKILALNHDIAGEYGDALPLDMRLRDRIIFDTFALLAAITTIDTHEGRLSCLRSVEHNCIEGSSLEETEVPR